MGELFSIVDELIDTTERKLRKPVKGSTELDGRTWLQYSISVWNDIRKSPDELALKHPAMFPAALPGRLIEMFTKKNDLVLDPFAGTGSTLIAASERERKAIGIELSSQFISMYKDRLKQTELFNAKHGESKIFHDDSLNLKKYVKTNSVQLTVTSPPYWDILNQERTADGKAVRNYGKHRENLGNIHDYNEFLNSLAAIFSEVFQITKIGGYCCVVLMDIRKKDRYFPFHMNLSQFMEQIGFELDDIIIWDRRQEYNNLRPLGYPSVFRVNKIHEYILIFIKR